jgi:hypothetical protein
MANLPAWTRPFFEKAGFLVEHTALVGVFLVCIKGLDMLSHALWQTGDEPLMFLHRLPVRSFFQTVDDCVLVLFAVGTLVSAIKIFVFRR